MAKSRVRKKVEQRHARITPLKAFELVCDMHRDHGKKDGRTTLAEDNARGALMNHVRNALTRTRAR